MKIKLYFFCYYELSTYLKFRVWYIFGVVVSLLRMYMDREIIVLVVVILVIFFILVIRD